MTIIIPYRNEVHKGLELKYAIRSIEKYLTGWGNIVLIGRPPDWYKGYSIHLDDYSGRKEFSVYSKLFFVCEHELSHIKLSDDFLYWNDDHYLLKPLHVSEIKYWHNGLIKNEFNRRIGGRYRLVVQNTLGMLNGGSIINNYDIHCPIIFNKKKFKEIFTGLHDEICIKSFYSNQVQVESEFMEDCKIDGQFSKEEIRGKIKDRLFFSTGTSLCTNTVEVLEELYPLKNKL